LPKYVGEISQNCTAGMYCRARTYLKCYCFQEGVDERLHSDAWADSSAGRPLSYHTLGTQKTFNAMVIQHPSQGSNQSRLIGNHHRNYMSGTYLQEKETHNDIYCLERKSSGKCNFQLTKRPMC
jgi:hypothetical protein